MNYIEKLKEIDPRAVDKATLVQRQSVKIDPNATKEERLRDFITQIKNPYCYLDGNTVVKISFRSTDITMEDCIEHYLKGL